MAPQIDLLKCINLILPSVSSTNPDHLSIPAIFPEQMLRDNNVFGHR